MRINKKVYVNGAVIPPFVAHPVPNKAVVQIGPMWFFLLRALQ